MTVNKIFEEFDENKNGYLESKEVENFIRSVVSQAYGSGL